MQSTGLRSLNNKQRGTKQHQLIGTSWLLPHMQQVISCQLNFCKLIQRGCPLNFHQHIIIRLTHPWLVHFVGFQFYKCLMNRVIPCENYLLFGKQCCMPLFYLITNITYYIINHSNCKKAKHSFSFLLYGGNVTCHWSVIITSKHGNKQLQTQKQ